MQQKFRLLCHAAIGAAMAFSATAFAYKTPAEVPAIKSHLAAVTPLVDAAKVGKRIVAVGLRGHIVFSDDDGRTWTQAESPVSVDLVAVSFPDEKNGWAVGHYGIILHSADGGTTWQKQFDGQAAAEVTKKYYDAKLAEQPNDENVQRAARQAGFLLEEKNTQTLLDVAFESAQIGYAVGTFNRIFRTEDGGKSWQPLMDRTDNPKELHFYSVFTDGKETYLVGEQGMAWRLDKVQNRFVSIQTPYNGTLFGIVVSGNDLLVYGMRGSLLHSGDAGKSWERVQLGNLAGISGGAVLPNGNIAIANQAGGVMVSSDQGKSFKPVKTAKPMSYFDMKSLDGNKVVLVGSEGVRVESLE